MQKYPCIIQVRAEPKFTSIAAVDLFLFVAVAVVIIVGTLGFAVAKMVLHFCFHHFFDGSAKQIF